MVLQEEQKRLAITMHNAYEKMAILFQKGKKPIPWDELSPEIKETNMATAQVLLNKYFIKIKKGYLSGRCSECGELKPKKKRD